MNYAIEVLKLLNYAVQGSIYFWFLYHILNSQKSYFRGAIEMVMLSVFLNCFNTLMKMIPVLSAQWIRPIVNSVVIVLAAKFILQVPLKKVIINAYIPMMILVAVSEFVTFLFASSVLGIDIDNLYEKSFGATALLYLMVNVVEMAALSLTVRHRGSGDISVVPNDLLIIIVLGLIFQTIVVAALCYPIIYGEKINAAAAFIMTVIFLLSEASGYYVHKNLNREYLLNQQSKSLNDSEIALDEQTKFLTSENEKAENLQKEMEHALQHIDTLETQKQISEHYQSYKDASYTDDVVLNTLLTSYASRFENMKIDYEFQIKCSMENTLDELDMVKLFSNLLDNAMEAVQDNPETYRHIQLNVQNAANLYRIEIDNDLARKHITLNKKVQGEGLKIIQDTIKHYYGKIGTFDDGAMYHTEISYQIGGEDQ